MPKNKTHPRGYLPEPGEAGGGVARARKVHDSNKDDLAVFEERLKDDDYIRETSELTGLSEAELKRDMKRNIETVKEEIKDADEFFLRDDVKKQETIEAKLGDTDSGVGKLDDVQVINDIELDLIAGVPANIRAELREFSSIVARLANKIIAKRLEVAAARRAIKATKDKGHKKRRLDKLNARKEELRQLEFNHRVAGSREQDVKAIIAQQNALTLVKDYDLLPAAFNSILGKLEQFPFWFLLKNRFRDVDPEVGKLFQIFALQMAGTPGLSNKGNALGRTTGVSVENAAMIWQGHYLKAKLIKDRAYTKYLGLGEDTTQFQTFFIDTKQRVRAVAERIKGNEKPTRTQEGKLTLEEWNHEISNAIMHGGDHSEAAIAHAAKAYIDAFAVMGKEARELGLFWTQKNAARQAVKLAEEIKDAKEKGFDQPGGRKILDDLELELIRVEHEIAAYKAAGSPELGGSGYFHRMYRADRVREKKVELIELLERHFKENPKMRFDDDIVDVSDPINIRARAEEAYSSILREADLGDAEFTMNAIDKREWLEKRLKIMTEKARSGDAVSAARIKIIKRKLSRIRDGESTIGGAGPLIQRRLDIDNKLLAEIGVIETDIEAVFAHYVARMGPAIETARKFGDPQARTHINDIVGQALKAIKKVKDPKLKKKLTKDLRALTRSMTDLRDITHGIYQIPDNPAAVTGRILRLLRNFNILASMGKSTLMAMADIGNIVVSQGMARTFGGLMNRWTSGALKGGIRMMDNEVELAGSVVEVALGMRYHQFTETGAQWFASNRIERSVAAATQRFFLLNLMGPWTDMAKKLAGGMVQSMLIENAILWKAGKIPAEEAKILSRLGISRQRAIQIADEWEASGSLKHNTMFIANTEQWVSDSARREFRAAMNNEVMRAVITPGAPDKPKGLLKSEWWKVIGQYKGFGISASHRILGAGLQQKGAQKYAGMMSMVGIAAMVDMWKRPDYINLTVEEQFLRAVELSGVTGIVLDLNDSIERLTAGEVGLRPVFGMDIRERNPNWANRIGAFAGAVPNQWLAITWALTSDEAETSDVARASRYLLPYNNLFWTNEATNRMQRAIVREIDEEDKL